MQQLNIAITKLELGVRPLLRLRAARRFNAAKLKTGEKTRLTWRSEVHIYFTLSGCVKLVPLARGSQKARFTQPLREKFALLSTGQIQPR